MRLFLIAFASAVLCVLARGSVPQTDRQRVVSYSREVRPFLERNCAPCHYGGQRQGGLSLSSVAHILKGGSKGAAVIPGKASASRMVMLMEHKSEPRMPPIPGAKPLDTRLLRAWIDQGARDDSKAQRPSTSTRTRTSTNPDASDRRVTSVAFSPNGRVLAVGGHQAVMLLESGTGRMLAALSGHPGTVTSLAFSGDGQRLFAGGGAPGRAGEIREWAVSTTQSVMTRPATITSGHGDAVTSISVSANGQWVAAGGYDHQVSLWPASATKEPSSSKPRYLKDHTDSVHAVAFSPDARLVASAAADRTVKVWNVQTGKRLFTLSESTAELYSVAFNPKGGQIAAGGADRTLRTWSFTPAGGKLTKAAFAHEGPILSLIYSKDGKTIITSGQDRMVKRWDSATLAERRVFPIQPDWPQAIALSPDESLLAVGRLDGSLAIYDANSGRLVREPLRASAVAKSPVEVPAASTIPGRRPGDNRRIPRKNGPITLVPASLNNVSPAGVQRGKTVRLTLSGANISDASEVYFDDPGITGKIVSPQDSNRGIVRVDASFTDSARIGMHRVFLRTPRGTTGSVTFAVGDWSEVAQAEPNDQLAAAQKLKLPATVIGAMEQPGDVDSYAVEARTGQEIVFEVVAQPIRSRLQPVIKLVGPNGNTVAENQTIAGKIETILGHRCASDGVYTLQLRDFEGAAGGDVHYRLNVGEFPVITEVSPLGLQAGTTASVRIKGFNLGGKTAVDVTAPKEPSWGLTADVVKTSPNVHLLNPVRLAVGADPEVVGIGGNTVKASAQIVSLPTTVNGRLTRGPGAVGERLSHYYRFAARKNQKLILEVLARRLGSRLDSEIEVLDSRGEPVERAVLRAVGQTELVLVDRDSVSPGLRLQAWDDFRVNDFVLAGREVIRIQRLPAGPDEDVFFRAYRGQRTGYLGTTPEFHSLGDPMYKVEIHPPASKFSPNGFPLRKIHYRNDDGGPLFGRDSFLEFTVPADGEYLVRLRDSRGQSGEEYPYRLMIHEPRPDFRLTMSPEHPNLPKDGSTVVEVSCERYDGFDGEIQIEIAGLPPGFKATTTTIESGETAAFIQIYAEPGAVTPIRPGPNPALTGTARIQGRQVVRTNAPGYGTRLLTLLPAPDIRVSTDAREVVIRPGEEVYVEARVARQGEFGNRVPIIVQNLPFGVRVIDVGLNGVLVTEEDESRRFTIYCEPWVKPQSRVFYVSGNVEGGVSDSRTSVENNRPPATVNEGAGSSIQLAEVAL